MNIILLSGGSGKRLWPVIIATSKDQVSFITNQLGVGVNVCVEPCRRDTFPAIALAT